MPRTVRRTLMACHALAVAAAVSLLAACGGGTSGSGASASDSSATESIGASSGSDFCTQAAGIDERVNSAMSTIEEKDPSIPDAFRGIADELRAMDPPEAISSDWAALADGLDRMADAFAGFDITHPESLAALDDAEGKLSDASTKVENYLRDQCGIAP